MYSGWQNLASWQKLAESGRNRQKLASWQKSAEIGRNWQVSRTWQSLSGNAP